MLGYQKIMEKVDKKYRLAIVCPFIDLPHYVQAMIDSIKTEHPYLLILLDNNSRPETKEQLEYLKKWDNVVYLDNSYNMGVAPSWNLGCEIAFQHESIEYVLIANNDIEYHPDCIDKMVKVMKNDKYALVTAMDVARDCSTPEDLKTMENKHKPYEVDEPEFSCFMIKRDTWNTIGKFDEKFYPAYYEDNDYHYRIKLAGKRGVKTSTALYFHWGSRTLKELPDVGSVINAMFLQNEAYFVEKWGGKPGEETYTTPFGK